MQPPDLGRLEMIPLARRAGIVRRVADELAADVAASLAAKLAIEARILQAYGFDNSTAADEIECFRVAVLAAVTARLPAASAPIAKEN